MMNRSTSALLALSLLILAAIGQCADVLITNYGANGSDQNDDSNAFSDAIAAANSGDVVRVPAGTFLISRQIQLNKPGVSLIGAGDASIIKASAKTAILGVNNVGIEIAYLTLEGANVSTHGIGMGSSSHIKIHHVNIRNLFTYGDVFGPMGIYMGSNVNDTHIYNNTFYNIAVDADYGGAIRMSWGSNRNLVEYNDINLTGRGGIFCNDNSNYNVIRHNIIRGSGLAAEGLGIEAWGYCNFTIIEHNVVDHWISVDQSHFCAVRHNVVSDPDREMALGVEAVSVTHGVFTDNQVLDGQSIGLSLSNNKQKEFTFIAYNLFNKCYLWGAQLQGETGGIHTHYLYRNVFSNTQGNNPKSPYPNDDGHGLRINGNMFSSVMEENQMINNAGAGIQCYSPVDFLEFINNNISGNAAVFTGSKGTEFLWEGNLVSGNGQNTEPTTLVFTNQAPQSLFSYTVDDMTVTFADESSDTDGSVVERLWDFNDGLPTSDQNPSYTYPSAGTYRVTLIVWDNDGRGSRSEQLIQVGANPASPTGSTPTNDPASPSSGSRPNPSLSPSNIPSVSLGRSMSSNAVFGLLVALTFIALLY